MKGIYHKVVLLLMSLWLTSIAYAIDIPDSLKPWQAWVLKDKSDVVCPFLYNSTEVRRCAWPSQLVINTDNAKATFEQQWMVYSDSWLALPGDSNLWPTDVAANGSVVPVTLHDGYPSIYLSAGNYTMTGQLNWVKRPEALSVPKDTGLIQLVVDGQSIAQVQVDENGRVWFGKNTPDKNLTVEENKIEVNVFRKLNDDIPLTIETYMMLDVSGDDRELVIGQFLLPAFQPLSMNSPLPARIEPDGRLRIQLRAGHWVVQMQARDEARTSSLKMVKLDDTWPENELWSFAENRALRTVTLEGAESVDPQQTKMPDDWKTLPTYLMTSKNALTLKEVFRGDPEPESNQLSLQRELWLDFDGSGYTVKDHITGVMNKSGRLSMLPGYALGRVTLNGQPQLITHLKGDQTPGVEVPQGNIDLVTLSRHERHGELSAVGWNHDFQQVSATLRLPPAWSLFTSSGIDKVNYNWVSQWTLWAIFLVLIISVAVGRLYSPLLGVIALMVLLLTFHQAGSPIGLWLNAVIVVAICNVLPEGGFKKILNYYRGASFVALVLVLLPFAVNQIRQGIYPQLEHPWQIVNEAPAADAVGAMQAEQSAPAPATENMAQDKDDSLYLASKISTSMLRKEEVKRKNLQAGYDANAQIQTGPGEPLWQWNNVSLTWSGPVTAQQEMSLTLWNPLINRALNFVRVIFAFALVIGLMIGSYGAPSQWRSRFAWATKSTLSLLVLLVGLFHTNDSHAEFPPQPLLDELKQQLLMPAACLPECAAISKAHIMIDEKTLAVHITVDALDNVSLPLLSNTSQWMPNVILVNGKRVEAAAKTDNQLVVAVTKGRHIIVMQGSVFSLQKLQLNFPVTVRNVELTNQGWQVSGLVENRIPGGVEFVRTTTTNTDASNTLLPDIFPPFVRVERTLSLDVDWMMTTRVIRVAPVQGAISLRVSLIKGESIISQAIKTDEQQVPVNLSANQSVFEWQSLIKKDSDIVLQAANSKMMVEDWQLVSSPMWHVEAEGIASIKSSAAMQWRPWPDEKVILHVQRPEAVKGNTLTIENVNLEYNPGQRESTTILSLQLLSSLGGNYGFDLPDNAKLQNIIIDGRNQTLPQTGRHIDIPLRPGKQQVSIQWQRAENITAHTVTPTLNMKNELSNINIAMRLPNDRWPLFVGGPAMGPAVLFWGLLVVILMVAIVLGKNKAMPLKTYQWVLLGLGMSTTTWPLMIIVVAWFFALSKRKTLSATISNDKFNLIQVGLILLTMLALSALFKTVQMSLLFSHPDMLITGNGSSTYDLRWYQDRTDTHLPSGWVMSLPMWVYRFAMLCWSLWLTFALMKWLRWGWQNFSSNGLWRKTVARQVIASDETKK